MKAKKLVASLLAVVTVFCLAVFAIGCNGGNENPTPEEPTVESISIAPDTAVLELGETLDYSKFTVTAKYTGEKEDEVVSLRETMISEDDKAKLSVAGDYDITITAFGKTTVLKVTVKKLTMEGVSAESVTETYSGKAVLPTVKGAPNNAEITYTVYEGETKGDKTVDAAIDAGVYFVEAVVSAKNYESVTVSANVTINKKSVSGSELTWNNVNAVYTGEDVELAATVEGLPEGITLKGFSGITKAKDKGTYTATAEFEGENKNYTVSDYTFTWSILDSTDVRMEKWYAAKNGVLYVAEFTDSAVVIDGESYACTVAYDEAGVPAFTMGAGSAVTAIALNGAVLNVSYGEEETISFIVKTNLDSFYAGEYSVYYEDFNLDFDETNGTAKLIRKVKGQDETSYNISLDFATGTTDASKAKITVEDSDIYFEYVKEISGYYSTTKVETVVLYNYKNPANFDLIDSEGIKLAKKSKIDELKATLFECDFVSTAGDSLKVTKGEDGEYTVLYNGKEIAIYAEDDYSSVKFYTSYASNSKEKAFTWNNGYYVFNGNAFYNKEWKDYSGVYYLKGENSVSNTETVSFNEYSGYVRIDAKINGLTSSTAFYFGNDPANSNVITLAVDNGKLVATLYKKGETEAFATVTFDKNGNASCGDNSYLKVQNLVPSVNYSGEGKYYSAERTEFKYDGKGAFTLAGVDYKEYTVAYDSEGILTVTLNGTDGENHTVVYNNDKRFVKIDNVIYLYEKADSVANGFLWNGTYVSGDTSLVIEEGNFVYNDANVTNVTYSFVDDGNANGRTVLQVSGKIGDKNVKIVYYSLSSVKVYEGEGEAETCTVLVYNGLTAVAGSEFKPTLDAEDSIEVTLEGKVVYNGVEVFPRGITRSILFDIELEGKNYSCTVYTGSAYVQFSDDATHSYEYFYNAAYFVFNGLYVDEAKEHLFYFDTSRTFYNNTDTTSCTIGKLESDSASVTVGGKEGLFTRNADGTVALNFDGVDYAKVNDFTLSNYFGTYNVFGGTSYTSGVAFNSISSSGKVNLKKLVMYNGEVTPIIGYNDYEQAYLLKNTDSATSASNPYLAVKDSVMRIIGKTKINGTELSVGVTAGKLPDSTQIGAVLSAVYGVETVTPEYRSYRWYVTLGGKEYIIEENRDEATKGISGILAYESWFVNYAGGNGYTLNGKTLSLDAVVDANGNTVIAVTYDGKSVEASYVALGDYGMLMTFTYNGVNYKATMSTEYGNPRVRTVSEKEYEFFFGDSDESGLYTVMMDGKEFKFDYTPDTEYKSYVTYVFDIDLNKSTYNGKALTFAQYVYQNNTLVFVTEEGSFAYNVNDGTFYKDVLPANFSLIGKEFAGAKNTEISDLTVYAKLVAFEEGKAVLGFIYDFKYSSDGTANTAFSVAELDNDEGFRLMGYIKDNVVVSYLLKEGDSYALYAEEQRNISGTYDVGSGKYLVIKGTHANGKYTYTVIYAGGAETQVDIDFNAKSFTMGEGADTKIVTWSIENNFRVFNVQGIPASAFAFELGYSADAYNAYYPSYSAYFTISISKIENGTVYYVINGKNGYSTITDAEGVLSADGTHIVAKLGWSTYYIFLNGYDDDWYKYVLLYEGYNSDSCAKYAGVFDVEGKKLEIKVCAESKVEEDDDDEEYLAGCKECYFTVTYLGKTVKADTKYADNFSNGLEFTIDGTTYVAKLVNGAMTVTAK